MSFKNIANALIGLCVLGLLILLGYDLLQTGGSQADAQAYLDQEIAKWMVWKPNQVDAHNPVQTVAPPVAYKVISFLSTPPNDYLIPDGHQKPSDLTQLLSYEVNLLLTFQSEARTPLDRVMKLRMTWNPSEKQWYIGPGL